MKTKSKGLKSTSCDERKLLEETRSRNQLLFNQSFSIIQNHCPVRVTRPSFCSQRWCSISFSFHSCCFLRKALFSSWIGSLVQLLVSLCLCMWSLIGVCLLSFCFMFSSPHMRCELISFVFLCFMLFLLVVSFSLRF